ncbi:hypothetical protein E3N88_00423 [Mikania micrantha]|uniref:Ubiquitinyl hydrolase 1 n=1 Tax=Mikania micrantha TaxID=192012 RepID=A0A5N6PZG9_9ASTR|nr:hypothetical protein E3N88_00423 [Mikania micrantha]
MVFGFVMIVLFLLHMGESSLDNETGGSDTFAESRAEYLHYIAFKCGIKEIFYLQVAEEADAAESGDAMTSL